MNIETIMNAREIATGQSPRNHLTIEERLPDAAWNEYVLRRAGDLYHLAQWERVFSAYGLPSWRLAAVRDGHVVGVLPLVWQRSLLFGNRFVSLPCFDTAGVLADDGEATSALVERAVGIAADAGAEVVLLRQADRCDLSPHVRTDKVLLRRKLPRDAEALWNELKAKVRNQVKKPRKEGLTVTRGESELLPQFFRVYSENMRDLGSPSHSREFFQRILDAFPQRVSIYIVWRGAEAIGAGFTMAHRDRLEIPFASSLRRYNGLCANHLMYWQILEDACRAGFQWFYFGRSTVDSGPYRFKLQWGAEPMQLYWYYITRSPEAAAKASGLQESYGWGTRVWQHLPLWFTRAVGPKIVAKVP